tara:strand:+ start:489 stop:1130 length:642 start_codon:yes stop_codon:yes gene_type:complete
MEKIEYQVIKHFGPSILKVKIPEEIVDKLNHYIDDIVKNKEKSLKLDHGNNLVGDVTQEFLLEKDFMKNVGWTEFLANCVARWILLETEKKITKFNLISSWVVRQFENEYNPIHWHGGHISGAGFLKVPSSLGKHTQEKNSKIYEGGRLQLINGSRMFMSHSTFNIAPKVGDFYFFPNYMMHTVYPFKGTNEERRSISFNAFIDNEIYDVYAG